MEQSVLDKITTNNWCYYYEGWRNGQKGGFVQKNGIYRFHEKVRNKGGILDDVHKEEDDNPIVAIGIVAYWLIFNSRKDTAIRRLTNYRVEIPKDMKEQFDNYTKVRFDQFKEMNRDNPDSWDWDWDFEFYTKYIIPHEIALNKLSEALFDYISDSDIALVRAVMNNYIKYLKKTRTEKGYHVNPELLVLRAIDSGDETKQEDLEEFEINTILDKLEEEGYVKVAWIEGHKPEAVRLLDKGRVYLKHLEEGSVNNEKPHISKPDQPLKVTTTDIPPQMPQTPETSGKIDIEEEEWDNSMDYIFDEKVNAKEVFIAMKDKKYSPKITDRRFYYVAFRVFEAINYFSKGTSEHQYLQWINLHFNDSEHKWVDDDKHKHLFRFKLEGTAKNLKAHPSKWNTIKMYSDLAEVHYNLAIDLKNTFTFVDGDELKDSESYEHLKDYPRFLSGATFVIDKYCALGDAYINKG